MPDQGDRPETLQRVGRLQCQDAAGEEPGQDHDRQRAYADQVGLLDHIREIQRLAKQVGHRLRGQQGVILNRLDFLLGELRGRGQFHAIRKPGASLLRNTGLTEL